MRKIIFRRLLLIALVLSLTKVSISQEALVSDVFGFVAFFPSKAEELIDDNALGLFGTFLCAKEVGDELQIYHIVAHKNKQLLGIETLKKKEYKRVIQKHFDTFMKADPPMDLKAAWDDSFAWPVIKFSCLRRGFLGEGLVTKQQGFHFFKNDSMFTVSIHGTGNEDLDAAVTLFFSTFTMTQKIDAIDANKAGQGGAIEQDR